MPMWKELSSVYKIGNKCLNTIFSRPLLGCQPQKSILIYCDRGVSLPSALGLAINTKQMLGNRYQVRFVNATEIVNTEWEKNAGLFIMPGGRARPFYESLGAKWQKDKVTLGEERRLEQIGEGNSRIRQFVENGGAYLGICAGAYYAAENTVFEKGGPLEVLDEGPLKFFSGTAQGPAYGPGKFAYYRRSGAGLAKVDFHQAGSDAISTQVYYNGGCFFRPRNLEVDAVSMAAYVDIENMPSALVAAKVGKGRAVLSGVHFETQPWMMPIYSLLRPDFLRLLHRHQEANQQVLNTLVNMLLDGGTFERSVVKTQACVL